MGRSTPYSRLPPALHLNWKALVRLAQLALLLNVSRTAGVTHWKLIDNEIMPEPGLDSTEGQETDTAVPKQDMLYDISQFSSSDPEFAMLIRYSSRGSGGAGSPNRGGGVFGSFQRQGPAHSNSCSSSGEKEGEGEGDFGDISQCPPPGENVGGQRKVETTSRQPRNPDGSGIM